MRWIALTFVLLAGCAGADTPVAADTPRDPAPVAATPVAAAPAPAAAAPSKSDEVVTTCSVDADCAVKNVGSCCGYHPACVHKDSPTFPERVKAECQAKGILSTCGFQEPAGCACVEGRCASTGAALGGVGEPK